MTRRDRPSACLLGRRGMTLIEVMLAIGVLATFFLVATALINASLRVPQEAADAHAAKARLDDALSHLRGDVWAAETVTVAEDGALVVRRPDGRAALWRVSSDGTWSRHAARVAGGRLDDARTWPAIAPGATFSAAGPSLAVRFPRTPSDPGGEVRFVSQLRLSAGEAAGAAEEVQ